MPSSIHEWPLGRRRVPAPASLLLLGIGALGFGLLQGR